MSLPQDVKDAIVRLSSAVEVEARSTRKGWDILSTVRRSEVVDSETALVAAIERAIAADVKPWRDLVERAVPIALVSDAPTDDWMRDAKALLEKPCSTS